MTPSLARRLACFVYEALVLFGLGLVPGVVGAIAFRHAAAPSWVGTLAVRVFAFVFYGVYFVGFWSRRGQTLPMQTWRIRLEMRDATPLALPRAIARYLTAWVWIAPPAVAGMLLGLRPVASLGLVGTWIVAYAALARLAPERQFWHDVLCGTRLVTADKPPHA
ncbi:MAG TPA: RDD family protein [Caldimonas sp.]|nr:RDD family protein [Caldimonas sp.]